MTRQNVILFGILILFISCKQTESKKIIVSGKEDVKEITKSEKKQSEFNSIIDPYIENDSLTTALKSTMAKITSDSKFKISKEPIKNRHIDNLIDTIITRTFKDTKLTSYKTTDKEWVYKANIRDSIFQLNDFIKVGIKKYVIEKSIPKRIAYDSLIITNLEQTSEFKLLFEFGTLKSIEYNGYVD